MNTKTSEQESYQIVPFTFENHTIRMALIDGKPWFIAKDVCDALGLGNPSKALLGFPDDERGITICDTIAGEQKMLIVNEAGLCRLIFRSRKPDARRFNMWALAEVLPAIRQGKTYQTSEQEAYQTMSFTYEDHTVRTVLIDDVSWFVAKDVCDVLGLGNARDALSGLDDDEKGVGITDTLGGKQEVNIINESGLYNLVFRSRKPEAKAFRKWVTSVVLPSLRQRGTYQTPELREQLELLRRLGGVDRIIADTTLARMFQICSGNKAMDISQMFETIELALMRSEATGQYLASSKAAIMVAASERTEEPRVATIERYIQEIRRFVAETGLIPSLSKSRNGYYTTESAGGSSLPVKLPPRKRPTNKDIEAALAGRQEPLFAPDVAANPPSKEAME